MGRMTFLILSLLVSFLSSCDASATITASAQFTYDYMAIVVTFSATNDDPDPVALKINVPTPEECPDIVDPGTYTKISTKATCKFGPDGSDELELTIRLSASSTLETDDNIYLKPSAIRLDYLLNGERVNGSDIDFSPSLNPNDHIALDVGKHENAISPVGVVSNMQTVIGLCDDIYLDARNSYSLGGRNAKYNWLVFPGEEIKGTQVTFKSSYVVVPSEALSAFNTTSFFIRLRIKAWYETDNSTSFTITRATDANTIVPYITIHGANSFRSTDSFVALHADYDADLNSSCGNVTLPSQIDHIMRWSIADTNNTLNLTAANNYLASLDPSTDYIRLYTLDQEDSPLTLIPGYSYTIFLDFSCNSSSSGADCQSLTLEHSLVYDASDITCQIAGGDQRIFSNMSICQLEDYDLELDGNSFTFDKDKSELFFDWSCWKAVSTSDASDSEDFNYTNCSYLLAEASEKLPKDAAENSIISAEIGNDFVTECTNAGEDCGDLRVDYVFTLSVSASDDASRAACEATQTVTIENINDTAQTCSQLSDVSLTAVSTSINRDERLRLITNGPGGKKYKYSYSELTGLLSKSDIKNYRVNTNDSSNLILTANTLESGETYEFKVKVTEKKKGSKGKGELVGSASLVVTVNEEPTIVSGSFAISNNCSAMVSSIEDLHKLLFDLYIEAESETLPLAYEYTYQIAGSNKTRLLHPALLSDSFLDFVVLPPVSEFAVTVTVTDNNGATASETYNGCSVIVSSDDICGATLSELAKIDETLSQSQLYSTTYKQYLYLFQALAGVLEYMDSSDELLQCGEQVFAIVIDMMDDRFSSDALDLCETDEYTTQLGQVLSMWLEYFVKQDLSTIEDVTDVVPIVYDLATQILNPCGLSGSEINGIQVDVLSVVKQVVEIYDENNNQITSQFSQLLIDNHYAFILSDLITNILVFLDTISVPSSSLSEFFSLLERSLYVYELASLSVTIPSETIRVDSNLKYETWSIRTLNQTINYIFDSSNIEVILPYENTMTGRPGFSSYYEPFDSVDIVCISLTSLGKSETNTSFNSSNGTKTFFSSRAKINLLSNDTDLVNDRYDLESNITILFGDLNYNISDGSGASCEWYRSDPSVLSSDGCVTYEDPSDPSMVTCVCDHLTTFVVLYELSQDDDDTSSDGSGVDSDQETCGNSFLTELHNNSGYRVLLLMQLCVFVAIGAYALKLVRSMQTHGMRLGLCPSKNTNSSRPQTFEPAFAALACTLLHAVGDCIVCWLLFDLSSSSSCGKDVSELELDLLRFGMFVPLLGSFYILSIVIYGFALVSQSLYSQVQKTRQLLLKFMLVSDGVITLFFVCVAIFVVVGGENAAYEVFLAFSVLTAFLMFVSLLGVLYFGYGATGVMFKSVDMLRQMDKLGSKSPQVAQDTNEKLEVKEVTLQKSVSVTTEHKLLSTQEKTLQRMITSGVVMALFLGTKVAFLLHFAAYPENFSAAWQVVDMQLNLVYLLTTIYLYHKYVGAKLEKKRRQKDSETRERELAEQQRKGKDSGSPATNTSGESPENGQAAPNATRKRKPSTQV